MRITKYLVVTGLVLVSLGTSIIGTQQTAFAAFPRHSVTDRTYATGISFTPRWSYLSTMRGDTSGNSIKVYAQKVNTYTSNPYISVATYSCSPGSHVRTSNIIVMRSGSVGYLTKTSGCFRIMMQGHGPGDGQSGAEFVGAITYSAYDN